MNYGLDGLVSALLRVVSINLSFVWKVFFFVFIVTMKSFRISAELVQLYSMIINYGKLK